MTARRDAACRYPRSRRSTLLAYVLLLLLAGDFAVGQVALGAIYRWRDANGMVHYDQSLPDAAISRGYEVINDAGEIVRRVPPPPTAAQRAQAEVEAQKAARTEAEAEARKRRDRILLDTFSSVDDIKHMRDERLDALDVQIELARDRVKQLADGDKAARASAEASLHELVRQRDQTRLEFEADIKRFRELKGQAGP